MINKEFSIVVFGATSFVGKILCNYLVNDYTEPNLSWAMAARSEAKLVELKNSLGDSGKNISLIIADSNDEASLRAMCDKTDVVISTVGPYALYGDLLVKACAASGTDYCDLTGEAHWIKRMIERYKTDAQTSGARIVHSCGFDSIPSDLGVKFLQDQAFQNFGKYCNKVKMRVKASKGGASGGTNGNGGGSIGSGFGGLGGGGHFSDGTYAEGGKKGYDAGGFGGVGQSQTGGWGYGGGGGGSAGAGGGGGYSGGGGGDISIREP